MSEDLDLLTDLSARARSADEDPRSLAASFVRHYYGASTEDSLKQRARDHLLNTALRHLALARRREAGQILLRWLPEPGGPEHAEAAMHAIETVAEDQPFLVDTLILALRAAGGSIDWLVHPVMAIERAADGDLRGVAVADRLTRNESLIHVEFTGIDDAASREAFMAELHRVLGDLHTVAVDFAAMLARLHGISDELRALPEREPGELDEAHAFLAWLEDGHFTFLGFIESRCETGSSGELTYRVEPSSGLGLLRSGGRLTEADVIAPQHELDRYAESTRVIVITKANVRSPIHHAELMDVVSVKHLAGRGRESGIFRFIGLFATEAYLERPADIPLIRSKVDYVMNRAQLLPDSHAGKNLRDILFLHPRDELFQSGEEELFRICMGIRSLRDSEGLRVFMRRDRYGRFYTFLVYVARDRYSTALRETVTEHLRALCGGLSCEHRVEWLRDGFTRLQLIVRTPPGTRIALDEAQVQQRLQDATRPWQDKVHAALRPHDSARTSQLLAALPPGYITHRSAADAATDLRRLAELSAEAPRSWRIGADPSDRAKGVLKLYSRATPLPLSEALPVLEHFGLRVQRQEPALLEPAGEPLLWIQEFFVDLRCEANFDDPAVQSRVVAALHAVGRGEVEDDALNRLVLAGGLDARQVTLVRALAKYLLQTPLPFSQAYLQDLLAQYAPFAHALVGYLEARFDPNLAGQERDRRAAALEADLKAQLEKTESLDADRVLRALLSVARATLRTNYFQRDAQGAAKPWLSLKLDPSRIAELPAPRPKFEIWVYAPQFEGIHLRGGPVSRGGLRWSDRPQDFRTEVLALMKAQMVKNVVIVPVGAKGAFVLKDATPAERDRWLAAGTAAYRSFLRGLLDLTDDRVHDEVVAPARTIRYDADDPYLVVAADKGTATFSDLANATAAEYGFWLGDAFASGGSAGYDHKKMGITARGAWESVKRHFREMSRDIQAAPFTVVGIGDMSGDVFGNGMLLSRQTRLVAAFDHRHIFIDPDPDPAVSFAERARLFALPRSSWADYDSAKISIGGGVWPRTLKSIRLSDQARRALDCDATLATPAEVIREILRAPVDLLWVGGIGTFVKASYQSATEVGDRVNDATRVSASELRCKVVGEGGNLGCTQLARIEFALRGGRINTDAIDNVGGVHTSDREVNIKIPLLQLVERGEMSLPERDMLLRQMTDDIAARVLRDCEVQTGALSVFEQDAAIHLDEHGELMRLLEREQLVDRALEYLPDDEELKQRRARRIGFMRPELATLLAYSKISVKHSVLESEVPDDPFFERALIEHFPAPLRAFREVLIHHRLRREIIATILTNAMVNRLGPGFAHTRAVDHGLTPAEVAKAFAATAEIFQGERYWGEIESAASVVPPLQYRLMSVTAELLGDASIWIANSAWGRRPIAEAIARFTAPVTRLAALLPGILPPSYAEDWRTAREGFRQQGVPDALAARLAGCRALAASLDIVEIAEERQVSLDEAADVYFLTAETFFFLWLYDAAAQVHTHGKWQALARTNLIDDLHRIHRRLASRILMRPGPAAQARLDAWSKANERRVRLSRDRLSHIRASGPPDFMSLSVVVRELLRLRKL